MGPAVFQPTRRCSGPLLSYLLLWAMAAARSERVKMLSHMHSLPASAAPCHSLLGREWERKVINHSWRHDIMIVYMLLGLWWEYPFVGCSLQWFPFCFLCIGTVAHSLPICSLCIVRDAIFSLTYCCIIDVILEDHITCNLNLSMPVTVKPWRYYPHYALFQS